MKIHFDLLATYLFPQTKGTRWGYLLILTVLIVQHRFTLSEILSKPMNTVSVVGTKTKMECRRNPHVFPVDWEFASAGSDSLSYIYISQRLTANLSSRYKIDTDNNTRYDIVIDSVDLSHAGTYRCTPITENNVVNTPSNSAQLIVLASQPVCNTNLSALNDGIVEGDYVRMCCTINYSGNWIPVMEWTKSNRQIADGNILYTNASTTVTSSLTTQVNSSDNGVTFMCNTTISPKTAFRRNTKPNETVAVNIPTYHHLWKFNATVLFLPRHLTIKPVDRVLNVGDRLECSADGNLSLTYEWTATETNKSINGSVLTIEEHMKSNQSHSFICTAYFTVAGLKKHISENVTFTVREKPQTNDYEQYIIIAITVAGTICCLVLIFCLCKNRRPNRKGTTSPEPDILYAMQTNFNDTTESSEDEPLGAVGPTGVGGAGLQQQRPFPVYTEVRREVNRPVADRTDCQPIQPLNSVYSLVRRETRGNELCSADDGATRCLPRHRGLPVYTEVTKKKNESKDSEEPCQTAKTAATEYRSPKMTLTGADGTQYLDVTSIRDPNSRTQFSHHPLFSVVETYASIDHTFDVPPPLPPKLH